MDYGDILIVTTSWQTGIKITDYVDGFAYFDLFGSKCRCNLHAPVIEHQVGDCWQVFDRAKDIAHVFTPNITVTEKSNK